MSYFLDGGSQDINNYFPHKDTLIMNTLISCLSDDIKVSKATLDLLIEHLPLKSNFFSRDQIILLMECVLKLFVYRDQGIFVRVTKWLTPQKDLDDGGDDLMV